MKLHYLLSTLLFIIVCTASAQTRLQDSLIKLYNKYPETAIKKADSLYKIGVKKRNNALVLEALILKTSCTLKKDHSQYPQQIRCLEEIIRKEKNVAMRSLLHSYVGELYKQFYLLDAWNINKRTELVDEEPEDMNTWSKKLFDTKINKHLYASIAPQKELQTTPIDIYDAILIKGTASDTLQPTLYDFLCHRFFELTSTRYQSTDYNQICPPELYSNAETFVSYTLPDSCNPTLKKWQQLLAFRLQQKENAPAALVWTDLERIRWVNSLYPSSDNEDLYTQSLKRMIQEYTDKSIVVEIVANYAIHLYNKSFSKSPNEQNITRKEIIDTCKKYIQKYNNYPRIGRLKDIINKLKSCSATIQIPRIVYPGEEFKIQVQYINLQQLQLEVIKLPNNTIHHFDTWEYVGKTNNGSIHQQMTLNLKEKLIYQDTIIRLKGLPAGKYAIKIHNKKLNNETQKILVSTSLIGIPQENGYNIKLQVLDINKGFPIANAKVILYTIENSSIQKIKQLITDQEGFIYYKNNNNNKIHYCVVNPENPENYLFSFRPSYYSPQVSSESNTEIITDRSIYRPGETVYFKGYSWTSTTNHFIANQNKKIEIIFRDANHKEINKINTTSNSFGSFTGSFVIPTNAINGTYFLQAQNTYGYIQVAEYKRPEFEIKLKTPEQNFHSGDTIRIQGKAVSYSGINIANTLVRYTVKKMGFSHRYEEYFIPHGETLTNSAGEFEIQFIADKVTLSENNYRRLGYYDITAEITDNKGETQRDNINIPVYTSKAKPTLVIPERINKTNPAIFKINLANFPPNKTQEVVYYLEKLASPIAPTTKIDTTIEKIITKGKQTILRCDSVVLQLQNEASGIYLFTAECNGTKEQQIFCLYSPQDKQPPLATYDWLIEEKTICQNGEKARILFGSSLDSVYVQYQIFYNKKFVSNKHFILSNEIKSIEIPYLKEYPDEISLYIYYIKNKHFISRAIKLKRKQKLPQVKIETTVFRNYLIPGKQERWQLNITNHGKITFSEVLAMMYDSSLDEINPHNISLKPQLISLYTHPNLAPQQLIFNKQSFSLYSNKMVYSNTYAPAFQLNRLNIYSQNYGNNPIYISRAKSLVPEERIIDMYEFADANTTNDITLKQEQAVYSNVEPIQLRKNLQATAFFYPQLQTDTTGKVNICFTVPDALTRWKFIALATTQDMGTAQIERYITTSKPLMVRPNMPRFLRSKDQAEIRTIVSNLSDSLQQGTVTFELLIPGTDEVVISREASFQIAAKQNSNACFQFEVPEQYNLLVCRIIAKGTNFNDGEQHYLPIHANEILVNTTQPIFLNTAGKHIFSLKGKSTGSRNYRLTLEMTANPIWYAVQALPKLQQPAHANAIDIIAAYYVNAIASHIANANPTIVNAIRQWGKEDSADAISPLSKNPELKSVLTEVSPWAMEAQSQTERIQSLSELFDENRLNYLQKEALKKLADLQTTEGGWSWFKNMPVNAFITLNVLTAMQRITLYTQQASSEQEKMMQFKAIQYLDKEIIKAYKKNSKYISYEQTLYLYVRSLYNDIPLGDALEAHQHFMQLAIRQWSRSSLYEKALLATTLQRHGFKEEAQKIIESLRQYAIVTPEYGMYWPNNRNIVFCNSAIQTHTAILEAFKEINGHTLEMEQMQQWLLRQKEIQNWGSVPSTIDAIHALLLENNSNLTAKDIVNIKMGSHSLSTTDANNTPGYLKVSYPANEITPNMLKVEVEKHNSTPSWGGFYLQSFQKLDKIKAQKTMLTVDKKLYIENINTNGKKELIPVDGRTLKTGEKIIVRLTLSLKQDMKYLHLKDLRAACLEPIDQLTKYEFNNGISYYKEVKDACTNFFFDFLPRGSYVIEYSTWIKQSGIYQDGIANLQSIYAPSYNAYSNTSKIIIRE